MTIRLEQYQLDRVKAVANDDILLIMIFHGWANEQENKCFVSILRKPGNIYCENEMFLKEIRNVARGQTGKHVSATICLVCHFFS